MIYTELTRKAMIRAYDAHQGQMDKVGVPYIFHPVHVAEQMETESETIAALLHDVVEDTDVTLGDLAEDGYPKDAIDAIAALTHEEGEEYYAYLDRVKQNPIAHKVKLADIAHNSDETRLASLSMADATKLREKYAKARARLVGLGLSR